MFEEYVKIAHIDERRRAFALDCVIRLEERIKREVSTDESWDRRYVERAKVFETYLLGKE